MLLGREASFNGNAPAGSGDPGASACMTSSILGEPVASDCVTSVLHRLFAKYRSLAFARAEESRFFVFLQLRE